MKTNGKSQLFPIFRITLFFALGIMTAGCFPQLAAPWMWTAAALCALCISALLFRHALLQTFFIFISSFFTGGCMLSVHLSAQDCCFSSGKTSYRAVVASTPVVHGKVVRCDILVTSMQRPVKLKASILRDANARMLRPGDGIMAVSAIEKPHNFAGATFDYARYMVYHGYSGQTFIYKTGWQRASADVGKLSLIDRTRLVAMKYRERLLLRYRQLGLSGDVLAVVSAMTLGAKEDMPKELRERYSAAGASHILALSGLHIGIIYAILSFLFVWRRLRVSGHLLVLSAVWAYVFVTGMPPSAIRSAVMVTIYAIAVVCFRDRMPLNALSAAAFVMLAFRPSDLFDLGFQMSFMAVFFILVFYGRIYNNVPAGWRSNVFTRRVWQMTAVSLAAQAGVAPLVMLCFGRISIYFLLANFIVVPVATIVIYGAMLLFAIPFAPAVQHVSAGLLSLAVSWMNNAVERLSLLPGGDISGINIHPAQVWMIYALVFVVYGLLRFVRKAVVFGRHDGC